MTKVYYKGSLGAIIFWGTRNPSSLKRATEWIQDIRKYLPPIPCVLVTDNTVKPEPLQWIGPGKIFESEEALDQFCKDHGFVDHFAIKSRDWVSGEKSVSGQAVNCLLDEILQKKTTRSENFNKTRYHKGSTPYEICVNRSHYWSQSRHANKVIF